MSIASAITSLQSRIEDAYDAIETKGGTLPQVQNTTNLPTAIESIPSGGASSKFGATIEQVFQTVTENDETTLNMFGGVTSLTFTGVTRIPDNGMAYKLSTSPVTSVSFPAVTSVGAGSFQYAFKDCTSLTTVSFPELTSASGNASGIFQYAFEGCTSLTSVSFPKLASVSTTGSASAGSFLYAFYGCTSLTTVSFPALTTVSNEGLATSTTAGSFQYAFRGCTSLTSASFPELTSISGNGAFADTFKGCTNLTGLSFPKLESVSGSKVFAGLWNEMTLASTTVSFPELTAFRNTGTTAAMSPFYYNKTITRFDFPKLVIIAKANTDNTDSMFLFNNCDNLAELHFGQANQAVIEAASGYATKWGAPSTCQIYFDL